MQQQQLKALDSVDLVQQQHRKALDSVDLVQQQQLKAQDLVVLAQQQQRKAQDSADLAQQQQHKALVDLVQQQQLQHRAPVLVDLVHQPRPVRVLEDLVSLPQAHLHSAPLEDLVLQPVNLADYLEEISPPVLVPQPSQEDCSGPPTHQQQALAEDSVELAQLLVPGPEEPLVVWRIQASPVLEPTTNSSNNNSNSREVRPRVLMPPCTSR